MNSAEKASCFLRWAFFLIAFALSPSLLAQDWDEQRILNAGSWNYSTSAFLHIAYPIVDPDPSLGDLSVEVVSGKLEVNYVPAPGAVGIAEFVVEYFPGPFGNFSPSTKAFRLYIDSSHIITHEDFAITQQDSLVEIAVLQNDTITGSDSLYVEYLGAVKNGQATISPDKQSISFEPSAGFSGVANLTYVAMDNFGTSEEEHATIRVVPSSELEQYDTIFLSTDSRTPIEIYMPDIGFARTTAGMPGNGTLDSIADGVFLYTPETDFDGMDVLTLERDSTLSRTVNIRVFFQEAPNEFLIPDEVYTRMNEIVIFDPRLNDLRQSYNIYNYSEPGFGILTLDEATNHFTFEPQPGFKGAVQFTYSMNLLGKYEETTVTIYVGNMHPVNEESYRLSTHMEVPIVINYEIPIQGYDFYTSVQNPLNLQLDQSFPGSVTLWSGVNSIDVFCDEISGYDMIVYTPQDGFTGTDEFQVLYCGDTTDCTLVNIEVTVEDFGDLGPCPCVDGCVWPGDANANGRVDLNDLLTLGWYVGKTGDDRNYADNSIWLAQHADDWDLMNDALGMNIKYADCNGDGVITTDDAESINEHYLKTHTLIPDLPSLKSPYPFFLIPQESVYYEGDTARMDIVVGTASQPVLDMHGLQFALNLPTNLVDSASLEIEFFTDSWLTREGASHDLQIQPWDGRIDAAISRVDGKPASGFGSIGTMTFIVEDDIEGFPAVGAYIPLNIEILSVGNSDTKGNLFDMDGEVFDSYFVVPDGRGRGLGLRSETEITDEPDIYVFPNPATGSRLNVVLGEAQMTDFEIYVYDLNGRLISQQTPSLHTFQLDVSDFADGMYIMQVITENETFSTKFEVLK